VQDLTGERAIHVAIFLLVLIGLCGISGWIIYANTQNDLLRIAGIALAWGLILLALYAGFRALDWRWWE
jgi:hypothetical protein